jgi:hypothetical protein
MNGRLAERRLPQDAEQRGEQFLLLLHGEIDAPSGLGLRGAAGLGPGAEAEIRQRAALGRRDLPVRHLVDQHRRLAPRPHGGAVPAERLRRRFVDRRNSEPFDQGKGIRMARRRFFGPAAVDASRNRGERGGCRRPCRETVRDACERLRQDGRIYGRQVHDRRL